MEYWKPTQRVLQGEVPLVKRPKLTDALLRKPPFRFLHDVISEICSQTGYGKGLYTPEELISTNIKDKESKLMYLWKIIDCVGITLNASVPVRPVKIVAGSEPEQTNVFLQMLAAATVVDKGTSNRAVASVLAGEKQPPPGEGGTQWIQLLNDMMSPRGFHSPQTLEQPQETSHQQTTTKKHHSPTKKPLNLDPKKEDVTSLERITSREASVSQTVSKSCGRAEQPEKTPKLSKKTSKPTNIASGTSHKSPTKSTKPDESPIKTVHENVSKPNCHQSNRHTRNRPKESSPTKKQQNKPIMGNSPANQQTKFECPVEKVNDKRDPTSDMILHTSQYFAEEATSSNIAHTNNDINVDSESETKLQHKVEIDVFARPTTGQETPQLLKEACAMDKRCQSHAPSRGNTPMCERAVPVAEPRPQSARKAPPTARCSLDKGGANFMQRTSLERPPSAMQGKESYQRPTIILDNELKDEDEHDNLPVLLPPRAIQEAILPSMEEVGKLVHDVLKYKESFEDEERDPHHDEKGGIILGPIRGSTVRGEDKQTKEEEIQKLKDAVHAMCELATPLGKSMEYLQEDMDTMSKEYHFWVKERDHYNSKLEEEKRITEDVLQAQSGRVLELDEEMRQQTQQINMFKAQILSNDEKIIKLLRNVTTRSTRWISLPSGRTEPEQTRATEGSGHET